MQIKIKYLFWFAIALFWIGCTSTPQISSSQLLGKWVANTDWAKLEIQISEKQFRYEEKIGHISYACNYKIIGNTIILFKTSGEEKHIVSSVSNTTLSLQSLDPNQKDVLLLDGVRLKKVN